MKKVLVLVLALLMAMALLPACGAGNNSDQSGSSDTGSGNESSGASDPADTDPPMEAGEFTLTTGNYTITLPMTLDSFMALGWAPTDSSSNEELTANLKPKERLVLIMENGNEYARTVVGNLSDDQDITIQQSSVVGFETLGVETLELPGGIVRDVSTRDDILAVYGEPEEGSVGNDMDYIVDGFLVSFYIDENTGVFVSLYINDRARELWYDNSR